MPLHRTDCGGMMIKGFKELLTKLDQFPKKTLANAIRKGSRLGAKVVLSAAKALAPVKTGTLKRGLKVRAMKRSRKRIGAEVQFKTDPFYGGFVEYGHKPN